ncbi:HNH endonuclease [Cryobacterium soli]|uniref:HNH endonuclease n=1 Tax=Cryobacterium soli TaxID=2220095 RepID=UPI000E74D412|nr:HNH endonuclease signature motif containing protein [Cryobacterium soli]
MATSNATPGNTPGDSPDETSDGFSEDYVDPVAVDPVAEAISAVIDPLVENEKLIAAGYAERTRLLAQLEGLGHDRWIIAGLCGDPLESGRNDIDTQNHGPAWDDEELARRSMATEVGFALRLNSQTAGMMIFDAARLVAQLPRFHRALTEGRIGWGHALRMLEVTAALPVDLPEHVLPKLEEMVLPAAEKLTATKFAKVAREIMESLHPIPLQERVNAGVKERRVVLRPDINGMSWLSAYLKADEAQAIYERLTQIANTLDDEDATATAAGTSADVGAGADAGAVVDADADEIGEPVKTEPAAATTHGTNDGAPGTAFTAPQPDARIVCRTRDQRRADAYRDLLLDGIGADGKLGRGIRSTVHITIPVLTLLDQGDQPAILDGYGPIDVDTARRLAGTATSFISVLTHPHTGCVLSIGRTAHDPPADLRRYVQIRDQTCQEPGCNRRAVTSDIDHTQAWSAGGDTSADNLVALCRSGHRLKHQSSFSTSQAPDGTLTWTTPGGKTYTNIRAQDLTRAALNPRTGGDASPRSAQPARPQPPGEARVPASGRAGPDDEPPPF